MSTMGETQEIDLGELRARLLEMARLARTTDDVREVAVADGILAREDLRREVATLRDEVDALESLVARQRTLLAGVAVALRSEPGPLASHGHHDLAERAAAVVADRDEARADAETLADAHASCDATLAVLRDAARETLDALEAPAPVWDADESEHDEHAARLEVARAALRSLVGGAP